MGLCGACGVFEGRLSKRVKMRQNIREKQEKNKEKTRKKQGKSKKTSQFNLRKGKYETNNSKTIWHSIYLCI